MKSAPAIKIILFHLLAFSPLSFSAKTPTQEFLNRFSENLVHDFSPNSTDGMWYIYASDEYTTKKNATKLIFQNAIGNPDNECKIQISKDTYIVKNLTKLGNVKYNITEPNTPKAVAGRFLNIEFDRITNMVTSFILMEDNKGETNLICHSSSLRPSPKQETKSLYFQKEQQNKPTKRKMEASFSEFIQKTLKNLKQSIM